MADKNWKYDYAGNQKEIDADVNIFSEDQNKNVDSVVDASASNAAAIRDKYLTYDKIRNDNNVWDTLQQYNIGDLQTLAFGEPKETHWVDFNILKHLLQQLQKFTPVKKAIEAVMKGIQTVITILSQIEKVIRYFAGVVMNLLSPWIVIAKMIVRQVRDLLKQILDGIFKFEMLGSSVLMGTFSIPDAPDADIPLTTDAQTLYDKFDEMTDTWKNRPTATNSAHALVFLPLGNMAGIPSKNLAQRLRTADNMVKDFKKATSEDTWDRKNNKFKTGEMRSAKEAYNNVYDTIEVYKDLIALAKSKFSSPEIDQTIKDRDPINKLDKLQEDMLKIAKTSMLRSEIDNMLVMDGLSKSMYESNGIKKISSPKLNEFKVCIDKSIKKDPASKKLKIEINGPRNNDIIIHKMYLQVRNKDNEFGEKPIPIYINPRTEPLEVYKYVGNMTKSFTEDFRSVAHLYGSNTKSFIKGDSVPIGSRGSIWKTISNLNYDYFNTSNSNDKDLIFLRELFLATNDGTLDKIKNDPLYGGDNLLSFSGCSTKGATFKDSSTGKEYTELYKPRYNTKTGNAVRQEATPWEVNVDMSKLSSDTKKAIEKAFNDTVENYPYSKNQLYFFAELLPGNAVLFDNTFFNSATETSKLFPAYWNVGNYGAYNEMFMVSHLVELEQDDPASIDSGAWIGYNVGSRTIEDLIKAMAPKAWDAISDARKGIFDFLDYLDAMVDAMQDTVDNLASLMNQVANIIKYVNADFFKNLLKLLEELFFEDTPALYFAIWEGSSSQMSDILKQGMIERGIQESIKGGVVIYANNAQIISVLEILNVVGKMGKLVQSFTPSEKDESDASPYKPTGAMPPFGNMMDPFVLADISPASGRYNRVRAGQQKVVAGAKPSDFNPEVIGQTMASDFVDKTRPITIDQTIKMLQDTGFGVGSTHNFRQVDLKGTVRLF